MAEKEFPPTDLKLQRLRDEGVVPFSALLSSTWVIAVFVLLIAALSRFATAEGSQLRRSLRRYWGPAAASGLPPEANLWMPLVIAALSIAAAFIVVVLVGGMLQNRFLWCPKAIAQSGGFWSPEAFGGMRAKLLGLLATLLVLVITGSGAALTLAALIQQTFEPLEAIIVEGDHLARLQLLTEQRLAVCRDIFGRILGGSIVLLGVLGLVSRVALVQRFRATHRMTRAELEAEIRETEQSPELRSRLRQR